MRLQCRWKVIEIFREELEKRKKFNATNAKDDLMGGLMQMKDEEGKPLRDIEVLDNIAGLIIAGFDTTSLAITWGFYYLAKYPEVLKKLRVRITIKPGLKLHFRMQVEDKI